MSTRRARDPAHDPRSTWTIKTMSVEARERAVRAAQGAGMTIGEWMELAIDRMLEAPNFLPPARSSSDEATEPSEVPRFLIPARPPDAVTGDLVRLVRVIEAAGALAQVTNKPVPPKVSREVYRRLLEHLGGP